LIHGHEVRGVDVDGETRCAHYGTDRDVAAIRFPCCDTYCPCHRCHAEVADHEAARWPIDRRDEPAVLCGDCGSALAIREYLGVTACPNCETRFNPGCVDHYDHYFEMPAASGDR
jgi:uncharacterized CHY-type Zn-finger protein